MIEWHNMRDKMPERHVDVLVCCAYSDYIIKEADCQELY